MINIVPAHCVPDDSAGSGVEIGLRSAHEQSGSGWGYRNEMPDKTLNQRNAAPFAAQPCGTALCQRPHALPRRPAPDCPRCPGRSRPGDGGRGRPAPGISTRHRPARDPHVREERAWWRGVAGARGTPGAPSGAGIRAGPAVIAPRYALPAVAGAREPPKAPAAHRDGGTRNFHDQNPGSAAGAARARSWHFDYSVPMLRVTGGHLGRHLSFVLFKNTKWPVAEKTPGA
jgi:hypothetical protein